MSVLVWILIGALASGLSVGYFLHVANRDRAALTAQAEEARKEIETAKAASAQLADEANKKLAEASAEVAQSQELIKRLENERTLLAQAIPLQKPAPRQLKTWSEALSVPLGVSVELPPNTQALQADSALIAGSRDPSVTDGEWLSITSYDEGREATFAKALQNPEIVSYTVNGHLLAGNRGTIADLPGTVYVLRVMDAASSTHLIWAHAGPVVADAKLLDTLSTLTFRS